MSSLLRYFDVSTKSLVKNIIKQLPTKPDFIGHFPTQSKSKENMDALDFLGNHVNFKRVVFEKDPDPESFGVDDFLKNSNSHQRNGMIGNFFQWSSMKECLKLKDEFESKHGVYDLVFWIRPDLFYYNELQDITNLEDRFYLVGHDHHLCGLNDRFCMGTSHAVGQRMDILGYFIDEWYPEYHNDKNVLFCGKLGVHKGARSQWNPEIVFKTYVRKKLKLTTSKLGLCFGKLRSTETATAPYWFKTHGNDYTGYSCEEDKFNQEVFEKTKDSFLKSDKTSSQWGLVDLNHSYWCGE